MWQKRRKWKAAIIAKSAVDDFLNRPLRDSARAKLFTERALDRKLEQLDPRPKFFTKPRINQKVGFLLGVKYPGYQFNFEMGLGKTKCVLDLYRYHRKVYWLLKNVRSSYRAVVLVPGSANVGQWRNETALHAPNLTFAGLDVSGPGNRILLVESGADVTCMTYAGFLALVCTGKEVLGEDGDIILDPETGEPKTKGWKIDKKKMRWFCKQFRFFIGDESSVYGNHDTLLHRAVRKLAWSCECRYGLTGTPYGKKRKIDLLWGQMKVIDKGGTLGETLGLFRSAFCLEKPNEWSGGVDYVFDERKRKALNRMLRHGSVRYKKSECADLPPKIPVTRPVVFDPETWAYYDRLVEQIKAAGEAVKTVGNAWMRMRQLTSGYLTLKDAEGGQQVIRFKKAPKFEAVLEWLKELPEDAKVVIFHEYQLTGKFFCELLKKHKVRHVWLYSGTKGKSATVQRFLDDPKIKVIVASSAGAYGGNWQVANHMGFLESPTNPIIRKQEEDRIHRLGQSKTCVIVDFPVTGSVDEQILESLSDERDLFDKVIEGKADLSRKARKPRAVLKE